MGKGDIIHIDPLQGGAAKLREPVNASFESIEELSTRVAALETKGADFQTALVVVNGLAYFAEVPMNIQSLANE